jgi:tetratricopeptide (TPR) repeat protein
MVRPWQNSWVAGVLLTIVGMASAAGETSPDPLDRAEALIESYYGDRHLLERAAPIVSASLSRAASARGYALAAQIVVKGGHIVGKEFEPGTEGLYRSLIDRSLALDPSYVPALGLLSESQRLEGDLEGACASANKALAIDPKDAWARVNLARCLLARHAFAHALDEIEVIIMAPPGETVRQRKAYITAQEMYARQFAAPGNEDLLRHIAGKIEPMVDPSDAWTWGALADDFELMADYDDAIVYGRKALQIMDYGVGRSILATAYFGKAAQLQLAKQDPAPMLARARALHVEPAVVRRDFESPDADPAVAKLAPSVRAMLQGAGH